MRYGKRFEAIAAGCHTCHLPRELRGGTRAVPGLRATNIWEFALSINFDGFGWKAVLIDPSTWLGGFFLLNRAINCTMPITQFDNIQLLNILQLKGMYAILNLS